MNLEKSKGNPRRMIKWNGKFLARCSRDELLDCIVAMVKLLADTKDAQAKKDASLKVFVDGQETMNFQQFGSVVLVHAPMKTGRLWSLVAKIPLLRNLAYKSQWSVRAVYEYPGEPSAGESG